MIMAKKKYPKLERLARELEAVAKGKNRDLKGIIEMCRDNSSNRKELENLLRSNGLGYFANNLTEGFYDREEL